MREALEAGLALLGMVGIVCAAGCFDANHPSGNKFQNPAALSQVHARWEVREVNTLAEVQELADNGWEPYASFNDNDANQHMLRKLVNEGDKP